MNENDPDINLIGKQIALDVFSMRSNNSSWTVNSQTGEVFDSQEMRETTIIEKGSTEITEPDVYLRYLYNIKSGREFMESLKKVHPTRTIYAPDSMYFQMRLKHPAAGLFV